MAGIASTDDSRLLSSINDLLGIPATIKQGFLGNLNTNTWDALHSGNGLSLWYVGERAKQVNFFGQDEWRIKKNLTMTYGVRWEWNKPSTEVSENPYVTNLPLDGSQGPVTFVKAPSWYKRNNLDAFAPRLGIAWAPRTSQKDRGSSRAMASRSIRFRPTPRLTPRIPSQAWSIPARRQPMASLPRPDVVRYLPPRASRRAFRNCCLRRR